jgi:type IX secretion system PorP/SprF family membrane protein
MAAGHTSGQPPLMDFIFHESSLKITEKMKKLTYTLLITFISISAWSQSEQLFTHYMFNRLNFNPAYAGSKKVLDVVGIYRNQWWSGIEGSPESGNIGAHMPFAKLTSGIGVNFIWDKIGLVRTFSLGASYAYRIRFKKGTSKESAIALGLNARYEGVRSDWTEANEHVTTPDPLFGNSAENRSTFNVGPGIYYSNRHFYLGAAIPRLLANSLYDDRENFSGQVNTYYLQGGAGFYVVPDKVELLPNIQVRINPNAPFDLDANLNVMFLKHFWLGANYRKGEGAAPESIDGLIGYQFNNGLRLGFAMDFTTSDLSTATTGSFEIMLGYTFPCEDCVIKNLRYF